MNTPEIILSLADKINVNADGIMCRIPGMGWFELPSGETRSDEDRQQQAN